MKPLVHLFNLFKKSSMILHLVLKAKSEAYIIKTAVSQQTFVLMKTS